MSTLTAPTTAEHHHQQVSSTPSAINTNNWILDKKPSSLLPDFDLKILSLNQSTLLSYVYCFIKNFIGASGTNSVVIDSKIEQAMDLVRNHLMFAIRDEIEVLKDKITELKDKVYQLERENLFLKANASVDTLSELQNIDKKIAIMKNNNNNNNNLNLNGLQLQQKS